MHTLYNAPRHPSGGIAKWPKATVCKTVIRGFKSHSRLSRKSAPFTGALFRWRGVGLSPARRARQRPSSWAGLAGGKPRPLACKGNLAGPPRLRGLGGRPRRGNPTPAGASGTARAACGDSPTLRTLHGCAFCFGGMGFSPARRARQRPSSWARASLPAPCSLPKMAAARSTASTPLT